MTTIATIAEGELDTADILLLVAVILFAVAAVLAAMRRALGVVLEQVLAYVGLAALALALLVL